VIQALLGNHSPRLPPNDTDKISDRGKIYQIVVVFDRLYELRGKTGLLPCESHHADDDPQL